MESSSPVSPPPPPSLPGYEALRFAYQDERDCLWQARRTADQSSVLIHTTAGELPDQAAIAHLQAAYAMASRALDPVLPHYVEKIEAGNRIFLVVAAPPGQLLRDWADDPATSLSQKLSLAARAAELLRVLEPEQLVLRDMRDSRWWVAESGQLFLWDGGSPGFLKARGEADQIELPELERLAYLAPERTGRIRWAEGPYSDQYGLGILLYRILSGQVPFRSTDPLELVHAHLAAAAASIAGIPRPLNRLLEKVLAKSPADRYQTAHGLWQDLLFIAENHLEDDVMRHFRIGGFDVPTRVRVPEKLFGRESELAQLQELYQEAAGGQQVTVWITGEMGLGKTTLAHALRNVLREKPGLFVEGHFLPHATENREMGLIEAIRKMVRRVLAWNNEDLEAWKMALQKDLGDQVGVLAAVLPELQVLFPNAPTSGGLGVNEEQNQFIYLFHRLLSHVLPDDRPTLLFLDDLHFADPLSLRTVRHLLRNPLPKPLLCLLATRPLDDLDSGDASPTVIVPAPLNLTEIERYFDTALGPNVRNQYLAKVAFQRTKGIPSFLRQFLLLIQEQELFRYNVELQTWEYDADAIAQLPVPEELAELIRVRADSLPGNLRETLQGAALLGLEFESGFLSRVLELPNEQVREHLETARQTGVIARQPAFPGKNETFAFQHDLLQEHFSRSLSGEAALRLHEKAGRLTWDAHRQQAVNLPTRVKMLVHFGKVGPEVLPPGQWPLIVETGLATAREALRTKAHGPARDCLETVLQFKPKDHFSVQLLLAQTHRFLGNSGRAENIYLALLTGNPSPSERLRAADQLCDLYIIEGKHERSLATAGQAIQRTGLTHPLPQKRYRIRFQMIRNLLRLRRKLRQDPAQILDALPVASEPNLTFLLELLRRVNTSSLSVNPDLFALIVTRQVGLTLQHGLTPHAMSGLMGSAVMNLVGFKDYAGALRMAHAALDIPQMKIHQAGEQEVKFAYLHFFMHLELPLREELDRYAELAQQLISMGRNLYAGYTHNSRVWSMGTLGINLNEIRQECEVHLRDFERRQELEIYDMMHPKHLFIQALQGSEPGTSSLANGDFSPEAKIKELSERGSKSILAGLLLAQLELAWYFHQTEFGLATAKELFAYLPNMEGIYFSSDYPLFATLHLVTQSLRAGKGAPRAPRKVLKGRLKRFAKLAGHQEANYASPHALIRAATEYLVGTPAKALPLMEEAARISQQRNNTRNYAIASELAFRMSRQLGTPDDQYLLNARQGYLIWGASAKVRALENEFAEALGGTAAPSGPRGTDALDLGAILKASNVLAGEIRLPSLLQTLMRILLENAGAQRGVLLLKESDGFRMEMIGEVGAGKISYQPTATRPTSTDVPLSLLQYVARTLQTLVLVAGQFEEFADDTYLSDQRPRALLCHPIQNQGRLIGLIYLENRLVDNAFTPARVQTLTLLSGQIGISVENARFYGNLEQKVQERTQMIENQKVEIQLEKQKSDDLLRNILPEQVANELRETGRTKARSYDEVTILFSDIVGFTQFAERQTPEELVRSLDRYFGLCDRVVDDLGLEKIKTIGDAYMCAGGLSGYDPDCHRKVVEAGQRMLALVRELQREGLEFDVRVGIHTGPVVAGVVGSRKFAYDIWGDAVNIAARMESASDPMRINISQTTFDKVGSVYPTGYRGKIQVKNKGELPMYFINEG